MKLWKFIWRSITSRGKIRIAIDCNRDEPVLERFDATQILETHPSERRRTCVISNSRSRGARIQMGRNERAVARKNAPTRGRRGGRRLQCYRTVERGIAESRDGGKREGEDSGGERETETERKSRRRRTEREKEYNRTTWCVRGVGGDCPTKPYGQNYHTHTYVRT